MPGLEHIATDASHFLRWLLITSASATLIAGVVLITQKLFSRWLTPGGCQRLWGLVIVRLLLPILPASAMSIANLNFEHFWTSKQAEVQIDPLVVRSTRTHPPQFDTPLLSHDVVAVPIAASTRSWPSIISISATGIWAPVAMLMLSRLLWVNRALSVRLDAAVVCDDRGLLDLVRSCARAAGLRAVPQVLFTDAVTMPAVHGIWRARILMPAGFLKSLTPTQRRHVILHEMSHIRCYDVAGNWLLAILGIVHWFNPLLGLVIGRIKADRELARDAWVIRALSKGSGSSDTTSYAETLVNVARR